MIKNYSFHAVLNDEALKDNELFWTQARNLNALWDALLEFRKVFLENLAPLYEDKSANREQLVAAWRGFNKSLYQITVEDRFKENLGWAAREAVLESFKNAHEKTLKTGGELRLKGKKIQNINFYYRFTNGGLDSSRIFSYKSKKLSLQPVNEKYYENHSHQNRKARTSRGIFGIGKTDQPLAISVLFHRPLPAGKIKTVRLIGELNNISREWTWKLMFVVDEGGEPPETARYAPLAAVAFGWRRIGDHLRIGYLKDTAGNAFEIRLPLEEPPNAKARSLLKLINRRKAADHQPDVQMNDLFPRTWSELIEWDEKIGKKQQAIKDEIKKYYEAELEAKQEISEAVKHFLTFFQKIGRRGLLKLLWELNSLDHRRATDQAAAAALTGWKAEDYQLRLAAHQTRRKLTNKRKTLYENIALWLKDKYSHLVWRSDLNLKAIAASAPKISMHSPKIGIKLGNKYRQFAGLSVLRNKIKEHNTGGKNWLIGIKMEKTTKTCRVCGGEFGSAARPSLECENGHVVDAGADSADRLLKLCGDSLVFSKSRQIITVPEHLKKYIVPVVKL